MAEVPGSMLPGITFLGFEVSDTNIAISQFRLLCENFGCRRMLVTELFDIALIDTNTKESARGRRVLVVGELAGSRTSVDQ